MTRRAKHNQPDATWRAETTRRAHVIPRCLRPLGSRRLQARRKISEAHADGAVDFVAFGHNNTTIEGVNDMATGDIETYFEDGRWKNKVQGSSRASSVHETKDEAQSVGRDIARDHRVEHVIKNKDGTIGARSTYGKDPYPPKG
jgi:hypothetical protein